MVSGSEIFGGMMSRVMEPISDGFAEAYRYSNARNVVRWNPNLGLYEGRDPYGQDLAARMNEELTGDLDVHTE